MGPPSGTERRLKKPCPAMELGPVISEHPTGKANRSGNNLAQGGP